MQCRDLVLTCAGSFLLVFASASYAADTPTEATANPTPEAAANAPAEAAATTQPQVAAETPADARVSSPPAEQMATDPCAGQASGDCEKLKRRVATEKTGRASTMAACTSHMDAKGKVVYDDPTCPSRIKPVVNDPGSVYLIRENPFFSLHIDKAKEHARAAEIAGNQGQAVDLLEHAQASLFRAKEAQRAGNVSGLNEAIMSLTEALRLPEGSSVRDATAYVRDARKNLDQAAGTKYKEIQPQVAVSTEK